MVDTGDEDPKVHSKDPREGSDSKVAKPDEAHYEALITAEREAIDKLRAEINVISEKINERSGGQREFREQRDELRKQQQQIQPQIDALENERQLLQERYNTTQTQARSIRAQVEALQKAVVFTTPEDIDQRISEIDMERMTSTLTLKEEKKVLAEIEKLKKLKPELARISHLQSQASRLDTGPLRTNDRLQQIRESLNTLRDKRGDLFDRLNALERRREEFIAPIRDLLMERDRVRSDMTAHTLKMTTLQNELRSKQVAYNNQQAKQRQAKIEAERFDRLYEQIQSEKKKLAGQLNAAQNSGEDWRTALAKQLKIHLQEEMDNYMRLTGTSQNSTEASGSPPAESASSKEPIEIENAMGKFVCYQKDKEKEAIRSTSGKRKRKPHKTHGLKVSPLMNHNLATLKDYAAVGIDQPPTTIQECPEVIRQLDEIVRTQFSKMNLVNEMNDRRRLELEDKLKKLEVRESDLLTKAPQGWNKAIIA